MRSLLLDRDGVINEDSRAYIRSPAQWKPLPGSLDAIARAHRAGFRIIVVSNQSALSRGLMDVRDLNAIHARLIDEVSRVGGHIEAVFFCPHGPDDDCLCRKPRDGLLRSIGERLGLKLADTPFIGDRMSDLRAARSAGARPILVRSGLDTVTPAELESIPGARAYANLSDAVDAIVSEA